MKEKINIVEILKDKPQGTKLYSSACGKCRLGEVDDKSFKISFYNSKFGFMNGWKKEVMSRGVKNSHTVYTKPDIEEYGYFPIYIEKGIGDEFDVYPFTDNNVCTQIAYIKYVHQLQHLLFGLGINHEMEV